MSESAMPKCISHDGNEINFSNDDSKVDNDLDCSNLNSDESNKLTHNPDDDVSDLCKKSLSDNEYQKIPNRNDGDHLYDCINNFDTSEHNDNNQILVHNDHKLNFSLNSSDKLVTLKVSKPNFSGSSVKDHSISYSYENAGSGLRVRMRKISNGKMLKKSSKRLKRFGNHKHTGRRHSCDDRWSYNNSEVDSGMKLTEKSSPTDYLPLFKQEKEVLAPPSSEINTEKDDSSEVTSILLNTSKNDITLSNNSEVPSNHVINEHSVNDGSSFSCSISNEGETKHSVFLEKNEIPSETKTSISKNSEKIEDDKLNSISSYENSDAYSSLKNQSVPSIETDIPVLPNGKLSVFKVEANQNYQIKNEIVEQKDPVNTHESTPSSSTLVSDYSYNNLDESSDQKPTFDEVKPNNLEKENLLENNNPVSDFSKTVAVDRPSLLKAYEYHRNKIDMYTNKMSITSSGQKEKIKRYQHKLKKHRTEFSSLTIKLGYSAELTEPTKLKAALGTTSDTALVIGDDEVLIEGSSFSRRQRNRVKKSRSSFTSDVVDLTIDIESDDGDVEVLEHSRPIVYLGSESRRKRKRRSQSNEVLERSLFEEPLNLSASSQPSTGLTEMPIDTETPGPSGIAKTNLKDSISEPPNASAKILEILESLDTPAKDYHHIASLRSAFQSVPSSPSTNDISEGAELLAAIASSGYNDSLHRRQSVATNVNCSDRSTNQQTNIYDHPWDAQSFQMDQSSSSSNVLDFSLNNRQWVNNLTEYQNPDRDTLVRPQVPQVYPDPRNDDLSTPPNTFSLYAPNTNSANGHFNTVSASVPSDFLGVAYGPTSRPNNNSIIVVDEEVAHKSTSGQVQSSEKSSNPSPVSSGIDCPICLDSLTELKANGKQLVSTNCGHLFCEECLTDSLKCQKVCPSCRKRISKKQFHRVYL